MGQVDLWDWISAWESGCAATTAPRVPQGAVMARLLSGLWSWALLAGLGRVPSLFPLSLGKDDAVRPLAHLGDGHAAPWHWMVDACETAVPSPRETQVKPAQGWHLGVDDGCFAPRALVGDLKGGTYVGGALAGVWGTFVV